MMTTGRALTYNTETDHHNLSTWAGPVVDGHSGERQEMLASRVSLVSVLQLAIFCIVEESKKCMMRIQWRG